MIYQIESIKTKTEALPTINKALLQVRHIQARINGRLDSNNSVWNSTMTGPLKAPVHQWFD